MNALGPSRGRISIVVACRNEARHIRPFLDSVLAQEMGGSEWEIVIADGMSDDGTRAILEAYQRDCPRLRVIENRGRIAATGLNAAIRAARGDFILRMDAHTRYEPDYSRRCVEALIATGAANAGGPARTEARGKRARAIAGAYHSFFSTGGGRFHYEDYEGWVDTVPYGCWRRELFDEIGYFDEDLVRNQDDEFNLRLRRAGKGIWQDPRIVSFYSPRGSLGALFRQYFQYGYWKVAVIRKHRLPGSWRHLAPAAFVAANVALLGGAAGSAYSGHGVGLYGRMWLALAAVYALANLAASVWTALRHGWGTLPYLPAAFATFHVSYGLGFLAGLLSGARRNRRGLCGAALVSGITRESS